VPEPPITIAPTRAALLFGYLKMGLLGFGGVAAVARHVVVVERRWLTERDYAEVMGVGQLLPGPNVGNAAVIIGRRFHGFAGVLLATGGLYTVPLAILCGLCLLYREYGALPQVTPVLDGAAAAGGGLVIGAACKTALRVGLAPAQLALVAATAAAVLAGLPVAAAVALAAPASVWWSLRRARA
jgi:chromate transporter